MEYITRITSYPLDIRGDRIITFKINADGSGSFTKDVVNDNGSMSPGVEIGLSRDEMQMLCHIIHTKTKRA